MKINVSRLRRFLTMMILTFLMIRPQCIISAFPKSVGIFSIIQAVLLMFFFVKTKFIIQGNVFFWGLVFYYFYDLLNTLIQRSASPNVVIVTGVWTIFTIFVFILQISKNGLPTTLYLLSVCMDIYLWINCILAYIYPRGLVSVLGKTGRYTGIFFLGQENQLSVFLVVALILGVCNVFIQEKVSFAYKFFTFSIWPVTFLILVDDKRSATGMMGGVVLLLGYLMYKFFPFLVKRLIKPVNSLIVISLLFIGVTRILTLEFVSNFIRNVLNKDITLSERTTIWFQVYDLLKNIKVLLLGLGEAPGGAYITIWTGHTFSAHNLFLQILLLGGMVLFSLFLVMIIEMLKSMSKIKDNRIKAALSICLFGFFLMNMLEVYYYSMIFLTMCVFCETGKYLAHNQKIADVINEECYE